MDTPLTICYFGTYRPDYPRNRILINGLRRNGVTVLECQSRAPRSRRRRELVRLHQPLSGRYQALMVGFPGHAVMPLARKIARQQGAPVVFDAFTSLYGAQVLGRRKTAAWRPKGWKSFAADWVACRMADLVLLDTAAHVDYLRKLTGLPANRFRTILAGSDIAEVTPTPVAPKPPGKFLVHFHGHYSKFQGVDVIVRAAKLLEHRPIHFRLIGRGQEYARVAKLVQRLSVDNVEFLPDVDYAQLAGYLLQADLCLGVFGGGTLRPVIPNKIYEALALGRPVLTGHLPAMDELFTADVHVAYCRPGDPKDLADQVLRLEGDVPLRQQLATEGRVLSERYLTPAKLGAELKIILEQIVHAPV